MVVHGRTDEHCLLVQGALSRGWEVTRKCLAHLLFWMAEVGIGGTVAWAYGGGMALIFIAALFLSVLIVAVATAPFRQRDDLRQAFDVASPIYDSAAWLGLEKDFRSITDFQVSISWVNLPGGPREWKVSGNGVRRFTPLAERAGKMLIRTPHMEDLVAPDAIAESNALWRWLCLLATDGTTLEMTGSIHTKDAQGEEIIYDSGGLKFAQERLATMCAVIAAKIA